MQHERTDRALEQTTDSSLVRRQIQHMIKYRYVPFSIGKAKYGAK